jgi:hypothetical protein
LLQVVLALALSAGPVPATGAEALRPAPVEQLAPSAEEAPARALSASHSSPQGEAVRQDGPPPRNGSPRRGPFTLAAPSEGGPLRASITPGLPHTGTRRAGLAPLSLRVLFCTWLN